MRRSIPNNRPRTLASSMSRNSPNSPRIRISAAWHACSNASGSMPTAAVRVRSRVRPMALPNVNSASASQRNRRCTRSIRFDSAGSWPFSRSASKSRSQSLSGAMNSLTNRSWSNARGLAFLSPHHSTTRLGKVSRAMPSCSTITCAMAARMLLRQVRAAKNDPRWAASCTLSEKAMTLWSSLWREPNIWASAVLSRLDARAPIMISASRAPQ